ncbi:GGDEF domain-containing protein [Paenibacillus aestuarii]|uniref:GGDEF domain-containing protein n=1 Tax=Paenibacillus aestuarii TaxID=516965 RepID=A0ABW0KDR3_9BACL|nr:GGDEF domain-containing protein [Paenibacillus aestuarii]
MNIQLDMITMFVALVVGHLFTAVLIFAYWRGQVKDKSLSTFFSAKCVQATTWFLLVVSHDVPDKLTLSLSNSFLIIGVCLEIAAVLMLHHAWSGMAKTLVLTFTACNLIVYQLLLFLFNDENLRIIYASIALSATLMIPVYLLIRDGSASMLRRIMGYFYLFVITTLLGRALLTLFSGQSMSFYNNGGFQTLSFLALYLVMISGNTGFALLMKERSDQELRRLANFDDLTGTLNRRTFAAEAQRLLGVYARKKQPVTLMLFDIDHFKTINDTYGHLVGDQALQYLAQQIRRCLLAEDLFARFGGDEFAILLPGRDAAKAAAKAEEIRQSTHNAILAGIPQPFTISLGVLTVIPQPTTQLEALYRDCDEALYRSKRNGRNNVYHV